MQVLSLYDNVFYHIKYKEYMPACNEGRIGAVGSRFLTDEAEVPG